jgi:hypothetical protein
MWKRRVSVIAGAVVMVAMMAALSLPLPEEGREASARGKRPMELLSLYLNAFHFHNGDMEQQMEVHHYCGQLNEDVTQCALYDSDKEGARLVGVEYVISEKAFKGLPEEEKKMWHSHVYEVKSGQLIAPGLSDAAEHQLMEKLISTYGKTWHTWDTHHWGERLPVGIPSLMVAFTADGQAKPALVEKRDKGFGISTESKKKARGDIPAASVQPGADAWQRGDAMQPELRKVIAKERR